MRVALRAAAATASPCPMRPSPPLPIDYYLARCWGPGGVSPEELQLVYLSALRLVASGVGGIGPGTLESLREATPQYTEADRTETEGRLRRACATLPPALDPPSMARPPLGVGGDAGDGDDVSSRMPSLAALSLSSSSPQPLPELPLLAAIQAAHVRDGRMGAGWFFFFSAYILPSLLPPTPILLLLLLMLLLLQPIAFAGPLISCLPAAWTAAILPPVLESLFAASLVSGGQGVDSLRQPLSLTPLACLPPPPPPPAGN